MTKIICRLQLHLSGYLQHGFQPPSFIRPLEDPTDSFQRPLLVLSQIQRIECQDHAFPNWHRKSNSLSQFRCHRYEPGQSLSCLNGVDFTLEFVSRARCFRPHVISFAD